MERPVVEFTQNSTKTTKNLLSCTTFKDTLHQKAISVS